MAATQYQDLLESFADYAGLDAKALIKTEEIVVDENKIGLSLQGNKTTFSCRVGVLPSSNSLAQQRMLLQANHFWQATSGMTLGLQSDQATVILSGQVQFPISAIELAQALRTLSETTRAWRKWLANLPADDNL